MTSPEVKVKISGDPRGFDAAVKIVQGSLKRLGTDLGSLQRLSASVFSFAGIGGAASIAGLLAITKNAAAVADQMGKLAAATGVSVKELSTLGYAAELNGSSVEELAKGLRRLAVEADRGGPSLKALGISLVDSGGSAKSASALLSDLAQRFSRLPDGAQKTALAIKLFGEEVGPKLIPLLNQGAEGLQKLQGEAERLGLQISEKAAAAAEKFNDDLSRLQGLARGVGVEVGNALLPALSRLTTEFLDAREAGLSWYEALVGIGLSNPFKGPAEQIKRITEEIDSLRAAQAATPASPEEVGSFKVDEEIERLERLRRYYELQSKRTLSDDEVAQANHARKLLQTQATLNDELAKLSDLRSKKSKAAMAEELKGAEKLRDALRSAWQESIAGAERAAAEAKKLTEKSTQARKEGNEKAEARINRDEPPEIKSQNAYREAESLRSESNMKAQDAIIAAFNGRTESAVKLAAEALQMAEKAEGLTEDITDNKLAGGLLRQLGEIKSDALKAQAIIEKANAKKADETAAGQQEELVKVETRIKELKESLEQPFKINADITEAENTVKRLAEELDKLKDKTVTVTVNKVDTSGASTATPATGFAVGGYTGPGGKYQPAGIVHAGEFVMRSEVVRQAGVRQMLERLNRFGAHAREFAEGGFVQPARAEQLQPINLHWPNGTVSPMRAQPSVAQEIERVFRQAALKAGGRR
jgi:hypothetical protein